MPIPVGVAGPTSLVVLADVKTQLQIPLTVTTYDVQLQGVVDAATSYIQAATGPIVNQVCAEVHDGGGPTIVLFNPPVISVTSVTEYIGRTPYALTEAELGVDGGPYSFSLDNPNAGIITRRISNFTSAFAGGDKNVQVTYVAGTAAVDPAIRYATLMDIQGLWTQTQYGGPSTAFGGEIGETDNSEGWEATASNPIGAFPRLAALLEQYKRVPAIA